jgi:hypothetical protein
VINQLGDRTHICMEISQGSSLSSYLYLKLAKMSSFSFYLSFLQNRRARGLNRFCPERSVGTSEREEVAKKRSRRVNTVQKMCIHACKCKNDTC